MCYSGKGKTTEVVERSVVARALEEEREKCIGETQGNFRAIKLCYIILSWCMHGIMHLSKPIELYNVKSEL